MNRCSHHPQLFLSASGVIRIEPASVSRSARSAWSGGPAGVLRPVVHPECFVRWSARCAWSGGPPGVLGQVVHPGCFARWSAHSASSVVSHGCAVSIGFPGSHRTPVASLGAAVLPLENL